MSARFRPPKVADRPFAGRDRRAHEAIYSLLMMNNDFICKSAHIEELDPAFADMNIVRKRRDGVKLGTILSNGFGFGGTNASLVFQHPDL